MAGRPTNNNADVKYDGDSYFFTFENATAVADIERDPKYLIVLITVGAARTRQAPPSDPPLSYDGACSGPAD
jgi:hypothetical protein